MLGNALEQTWGAFRFNLYFFAGVLFHVLAAIVIYLLTGAVYMLNTTYLNLSLFFAFAALYPDMQFLLFSFSRSRQSGSHGWTEHFYMDHRPGVSACIRRGQQCV